MGECFVLTYLRHPAQFSREVIRACAHTNQMCVMKIGQSVDENKRELKRRGKMKH